MEKLKIPSFLNFGKKYGLLISDTDVLFIAWERGNLERIAHFDNDEGGIAQFSEFLNKNAKEYKNKAFHILTNIIGEDYRMEKVAHLIGQYRAQFHGRRMKQLFRGSNLCMSIVQGREERGRREDFVLFYGLLTENKISPWMAAITRGGGRYLAEVNSVAFSSRPILDAVTSSRKGNHILMTMHEKGMLRQTHYINGKIRFSRVSKIRDGDVEEIAGSIKKELERTFQYLNLMKISIADGIKIHVVSPVNIVGQLRELLQGSQRVNFDFYDVATVARKMGLNSQIDEAGKDSSLAMHSMFSHVWFKQLANFFHVRYHILRTGTNVAMLALVIYGLYAIVSPTGTFLDAYRISGENQILMAEREKKREEADIQSDEDSISLPANIEAVTRTFDLFSKIKISPTQLIYYFSLGLEKNQKVLINEMNWYVTDNVNSSGGDVSAFLSGGDILQVLEVTGEFSPIPNETYLDVSNRAEKLENSFDERPDIRIEYIERPEKDLGTSALGGTLTEQYNVDAARSRVFKMRVIWKVYGEEDIQEMAGSGQEA